MSPYLERLSTLLDDEPAITAGLGRRAGSLAVADPDAEPMDAARLGRLFVSAGHHLALENCSQEQPLRYLIVKAHPA